MKAFLSLTLLTIVTMPGWAVELELKWQPGKRYHVEHSVTSAMKMPVPGQGMMETTSSMMIEMRQDAGVHEKGTKVSVAMERVRMKSEVAGATIEYDSQDPAKAGGLLGPMLKPLADAKFDTIFDKAGSVVEVQGLDKVQAPGQLGFGKGELEAMAKQSAELMPGKPVEVGDSWDAVVEMPMGGLGNDVALVYTMTLDGVEEREGRKIALVSIAGKLKEGVAADEGAALVIEPKSITGAMEFDLELGQPVLMKTTVDMLMAVPAGVPVEEGAPGKMPVLSTSVQKLTGMEDVPAKKAEE